MTATTDGRRHTPSTRSSARPDNRAAPGETPSSSSKRHDEEEEEVMPASAPPNPGDPRALRLKLLNLIHSFYLEALSRLPTAQLWSTHARGILVAGHCYGPLSPVDNILINAIWYDAACPLRPTADFHFGDVLEIAPESMTRISHRSLEGLVACLLHVCPSLSRDDALCHLDLSRADLSQAITTASGSDSAALAPSKAAYLAAAEAAHHPMPSAMALFASSVLPKVEHDAGMLLGTKQVLSTPVLDRLSALLVPFPLPEDLCPPPPLVTPWKAAVIKCHIENAKVSQEISRQLIETALCKYARQTGQHYELHFITGTNLLIHLKAYWHINILARPKDAASELVPIYTSLLKQLFPRARTTNSSRKISSYAAQSHRLESVGVILVPPNASRLTTLSIRAPWWT